MFALVGAIASIVSYGQDTFPDVEEFPIQELRRIVREMDEALPASIRFASRRLFYGPRYHYAVLLNSIAVQVDLALTELDGDPVGPAGEVRARAAVDSQRYVRAFVRNRSAIDAMVKRDDLVQAAQQLGFENGLAKTMDDLARRASSARVNAVMQAPPDAARPVEPEVDAAWPVSSAATRTAASGSSTERSSLESGLRVDRPEDRFLLLYR